MSETKTQISLKAIVQGAADNLMVMQTSLMDTGDSSRRITEYRYLVFGLMEKEGYTHQQIGEHFKMNRESITKALAKLDWWLEQYKETRDNMQRLCIIVLKQPLK